MFMLRRDFVRYRIPVVGMFWRGELESKILYKRETYDYTDGVEEGAI